MDTHFIKLKAIISMRKLEEGLHLKIPHELIFAGALFLALVLFIIAYIFTSMLPENYRFELMGLMMAIYFTGWVVAPLSGARLNDFFDFRAFFNFPLSNRRIFIYSVASSLLDASVLPSWAMVAGASFGLVCDISRWWFLPVYVLMLLFVFLTVAASQISMLLFYAVLRKSRWFSFCMTFILPLGFFLVTVYAYSTLVFSMPFFDLFSRPEITFLQTTRFLPSSALLLSIKSLLAVDILSFMAYFAIFMAYLGVFIGSGAFLIRKIQTGDERNFQTIIGGKSLRRLFSSFLQKIVKLFPSQAPVIYLAFKEFKVFFREPHVKIIVLLPLLSACFGWIIVSLVAEIDQGTAFVFYAWPVFFYGALFIIAADFSGNMFGMEKEGIYLLFGLPLQNWQIIVGKNLGLFAFISLFAFFFSLLAFMADAHSWHTLHALYLYFVLGLFMLFIQGNIISLYFPLRIDSGASAALQRESFGRMMALLFCRLFFSVLAFIFVLPILAVCLSPFLGQELLYLRPFSMQDIVEKLSGLRFFADNLFNHYIFLLYGLGAYFLGLLACSGLLRKRREIILSELCRRES
jgi:hypothetical protein